MDFNLFITVIYLLVGGFLIFLAITVTRDNFTNSVNRVTGGLLFFAGIGPIAVAIGSILDQSPGEVPLNQTRIYHLHKMWEIFFPTLVAFSLQFPANRLRLLRNNKLIYMLMAPQIVNVLILLTFGEINQISTSFEDKAAESGIFGIVLGPLSYLFSRLVLLLGLIRANNDIIFGVVNFSYAAAAIYFLESGRRFVKNPRLMSQADAILWGVRISISAFLLSLVLPYIWDSNISSSLSTIFRILAIGSGVTFFTYAIVKHQFLDVRLVFRQSLIYTLVTTILAGSLVIASIYSTEMLEPLFGERAEVMSFIFIIFLLLLFAPINNWFDNVIRSMFMRTSSDHRNILERFSRQVISLFDPKGLRQSIEETFKTSLLVNKVFFVLFDDSVGEYAILKSDDYEKRTVINREDMMLRGINLLDGPTNITSLADYEKDSSLSSTLKDLQVKLILPLKDSHHLLGFVALSDKVAGYRYTPEDFNLLGVMSNQMVTALTNARLYADSLEKIRLQEEVSMARQIQIDLLPTNPPKLKLTDIFANSTPSRTVGGDFYDFIPVECRNRMGVVIADASGKGMPAALMVAQIQAILRSEITNGNSIDNILSNMNQLIVNSTSSEKYVTLFYGELDQDNNEFHYSNAGHNYPILVRHDGSVELLEQGGPIIGALPNMTYLSSSVQLKENDLLFLFTDGLSEAMNSANEEYGEERIRDFIVKRRENDPKTIVTELMRDVRSFDPSHPPQDDTTIIVMKMTNGLTKYETIT